MYEGMCACVRERQNVCQTRLIKLFIVNMLKQCESVVFKELINPRKYVKGRADVEGGGNSGDFPNFPRRPVSSVSFRGT